MFYHIDIPYPISIFLWAPELQMDPTTSHKALKTEALIKMLSDACVRDACEKRVE